MRILDYLGWGILHERMQIPCQDAAGYGSCANGNTIMVLADGAGSSKYAREAAQANVDAIMDYFRRTPVAEFARMSPEARVDAIIDRCQEQIARTCGKGAPVHGSDVCATVLFAVQGDDQLVLGHLGDGMVHVCGPEGEPRFHSGPQNPDGDRKRTYFTVSPDARKQLRLHLCDSQEGQTILLMSDGAYGMFEHRGGGSAEATAEELMGYVRQEKIRDRKQLAGVLDRMTRLPSERLDDWSILIGLSGLDGQPYSAGEAVSMLAEEYQKIKMMDGGVQ